MNRKLKNTIGLIILLIFILVAGIVYIYVIQANSIEEKQKKIKELTAQVYVPEKLESEVKSLSQKSQVLDSILAKRSFNIPANLSSIKFYNFINTISEGFSPKTQLNIELVNQFPDKEFYYYEYKISGTGEFNDVYKTIYAVEQSKELKKIKSVLLRSIVSNDKKGIPNFLVSFVITVDVYFSTNDRFSTKTLVENNLNTGLLYDSFYPLIRNEIPPNIDNLLDVQGAKLLALIPEGAFIADKNGNTYLLWQGEQVYLGYLTNIDYENNKVSFILNKGGIIENVVLELEKEKSKK